MQTSTRLLRLREQHQDPRTLFGLERELLFIKALWGGKAVAGRIKDRLPINEQHVVMRLLTGNAIDGDSPRILDGIVSERHGLPPRKRSNDLHARWSLRFRRRSPAEHARVGVARIMAALGR